MDENEIITMAKSAYALSAQLAELEAAMANENALNGYAAFAKNYNSILEKAKNILTVDDTLAKTVAHLTMYDAQKEYGYAKEFEEIRADISILKATLSAFFEFTFPKKEKQKMGFDKD